MSAWQVYVPGPVMTDNAVTKMHRLEWARRTRDIRETWGWAARAAKVPKLQTGRVVVLPRQLRGKLADTAACSLYVKAAIDGMVDVDVFHDDGPDYLWEVAFRAPIRADEDGLLLRIEGLPRV